MSSKPERKSFDAPDETRTFDKGHIELVNLGGITFGKVTFEPGWRWSECVRPLVGTDSCQATHIGYGLSGRIHVVMDDGTEFESGPGEASVIPPGHDAWVIGDEPCVSIDFDLGDYARPST